MARNEPVKDDLDIDAFAGRFTPRSASVGVIGLCYVGLSPVDEITASGPAVAGFDVDGNTVPQLNVGWSYIKKTSRFSGKML